MLDPAYDDAFIGLSYNERGVPFPIYSLDECAAVASERESMDLEKAIEELRHFAATERWIIFVEELPDDKVGLRGVH